MRLICILPIGLLACAPELPPEQIAAQRAEALLRGAGSANAVLLAPISGLDARARIGVCGLIETPAGPVRVVVDLHDRTVRIGVPAAQGGNRRDLGEGRFCSEGARERWEQYKRVDPVRLVARLAE